ncbi:MAG: response regulator [Acidimicrobiales bacterium]|nr:response regulator [Acidimicrobiales bacterium]HRW36692.1 ATP-binding protein [Aquihabitans sp.]
MALRIRAREGTIDASRGGETAAAALEPLLPLDPDRELRPPDLVDRVVSGIHAIAESVRGRLGWVGIAASLAVGLIALESSSGIGTHGPATLLASIAAAVCFAVAWQAPGRCRFGWGAISLGSMLWCAGNGARPLWRSAPASNVTMSIGDVAALVSMVAFAVGILILLEKPDREVARLRFVAEGFMVAASVLFAGWVTVLPPAFEAIEGRPFTEQALLLAYPISDVLLLGVVVFAFTKLPLLGRWSVVLLPGVGTIALLSSAMSELDPSVAERTNAIDVAVAMAFVAVAVAAVRVWRTPVEQLGGPGTVPQRAQLALLVAPGLSILIVVGTTLRQATGQPVAVELTWITIAVLTLAVLLHVTVIVENHTLGRELALARDEAIHASVLKSHFLANVSHEIRTPMNAVIGLTGLLLDTELDEDQRELAVGVATSAEGLLGLIDSLLDFSKIEAEKMDLEEIDLDLTDLIDEVAMLMGEAARRKGIELIAYCEPGMVTQRRGDPVRMRQILLNLANNAVKFTSQGSVTIQAMPGPGGPEQVSFLVIDTGIGIPEAEQARLFEPFSQLDESTTRNCGGTGLGLGIVRGLVDLMGGEVEMASEEGVGTVFRITLPLTVGANQATEQGLAALVGLRALVVDGNAVNRSVLAHTLHSWGFVVDQATSAEDALHHYGWSDEGVDSTYAVAIIDRALDGMDGVELARVLHQQRATSDTVILLLSSTMDLSRQAAREAGIESVLIRPVRTSYLLRRIVDALVNQTSTTPTTPEPVRAGQS